MKSSMLKGLLFALLGLTGMSALGFDQTGREHHGHDQHSGMPHTPLPMTSRVPEGSLHQLDAVWQTHRGDALTLADLAGRPVIITMLYASCTTACPVLVQDVKRIYQALPEARRSQAALLLVSFDTEGDTPEALNQYAQSVRADGEAWHFATGSAADVRTLAALLGVRYRKNPSGGYDHSNVIAVLNAKGEVVHRQEGLNQPVTGAVKAVSLDGGA
ncbi:SCO family protein [Marinimicrobium agarilyticum]|uniref:SCO family protein n=1 Tax=Marinimicrobium agarilyticum TaxID=306546 RepID=UPI000422ED96|nr:SCO family protein [Marinimicrobium agarilyticum]